MNEKQKRVENWSHHVKLPKLNPDSISVALKKGKIQIKIEYQPTVITIRKYEIQ